MSYWKRSVIILCWALFTFSCTVKRESSHLQELKRPRFVFVTNGNSPFWDAAYKGLQDAAVEFSAEVEMIRNDMSTDGQIRRLEQVGAQRDVKGVMVSVLEPNASGIIDQMKAIRAKGIPVLTLDSDGRKETRDAYIGTNNVEAGRALGKAAAQLLPEGGKAVVFVGIRSAQNALERINGFKEGVGTKIQVVDIMEDAADVNKARRNVNAALQNHPDAKMFVGIWSYNAPAIADEVEAAGKRSALKLVTFDAEPNTLLALKKGLIDVTAVQNPYQMAYLGVKVLKAMLSGDQTTVRSVVGDERIHDTGVRLVVPDDLKGVESEYLIRFTDFKKDLDSKGLESS